MRGEGTADGQVMAGMIVANRKDGCPIVVDVGGGYAGAVIERMKDNNIAYAKFDGASGSIGTALGSGLKFHNKRAEAWWRFREALDPDQEGGSVIALPMDTELKADLTAPKWELSMRGIKIEAKEDIKSRIGRSPDKGDSVVMCMSEGDKAVVRRMNSFGGRKPRNLMGYSKQKRGR